MATCEYGCCTSRDAVAIIYRIWLDSEEEAEQFLREAAELRQEREDELWLTKERKSD